jgi:hypothetical protein
MLHTIRKEANYEETSPNNLKILEVSIYSRGICVQILESFLEMEVYKDCSYVTMVNHSKSHNSNGLEGSDNQSEVSSVGMI